MALSSNQYALKVQRLEKILAQTAALKSARMAKSLTFSQGHPKPAFSKKVQGGDQGKFFQKSPKKQPSFKSPKSSLAQVTLCSIQYALIVQRLERILAQKAAPKGSEWPTYENFGKVTQNPHFLKKEQRGDQGKFFKNRPKSSLRLKGPKALWRKLNYTLIKMHLKCKDWRIFWRKQRLQKCPNRQVMAIIARSPKSRIF